MYSKDLDENFIKQHDSTDAPKSKLVLTKKRLGLIGLALVAVACISIGTYGNQSNETEEGIQSLQNAPAAPGELLPYYTKADALPVFQNTVDDAKAFKKILEQLTTGLKLSSTNTKESIVTDEETWRTQMKKMNADLDALKAVIEQHQEKAAWLVDNFNPSPGEQGDGQSWTRPDGQQVTDLPVANEDLLLWTGGGIHFITSFNLNYERFFQKGQKKAMPNGRMRKIRPGPWSRGPVSAAEYTYSVCSEQVANLDKYIQDAEYLIKFLDTLKSE